MQLARREARHLVNGFFERDDVLFPDVLAEDARERPEVARMRHAGAQRSARRQRRSVRADRHPRLPQRERQIAFINDEVDAADAAALGQKIEDEVERILARLLRRIVDAHPFVFLVR